MTVVNCLGRGPRRVLLRSWLGAIREPNCVCVCVVSGVWSSFKCTPIPLSSSCRTPDESDWNREVNWTQVTRQLSSASSGVLRNPGIPDLGLKWVRLAKNVTKSGFGAKFYWNIFMKKILGLSYLGSIWPKLGQKLATLTTPACLSRLRHTREAK